MVTQMRGRQKNRRRHVRKILDISMTRFAGVVVLAGKVRLHSLTAIKECRDGRTAMIHVGIICTDHDDVANVYKYDRCRTFCGNILLRSELALSIQLSGHFGFPGDRCGTRGRKEYRHHDCHRPDLACARPSGTRSSQFNVTGRNGHGQAGAPSRRRAASDKVPAKAPTICRGGARGALWTVSREAAVSAQPRQIDL
jgi:hypothetical protein